MNRKKIRNQYKESLQNISAHYNRLLKDSDSEDNHNFRVAIKKLRAFVRLINTSQYCRESKIPKRIRKFYHLAGDIRNLQLQQERIKSLCKDLLIGNPQLYLDGIHKEEKCLEKKARNMAALSFKGFEKKLSCDANEDLSEENKKEFIKGNIERLALLLALPVYYDETFHDIRKVKKDIMYNYEYLEDQINSLIPSPLNDLNFMKSLTDTLGNFHDLSLALFFLSPPYPDQICYEKEETILNELKTHFQLRKTNLEDELLHVLAPVKNNIEEISTGISGKAAAQRAAASIYD